MIRHFFATSFSFSRLLKSSHLLAKQIDRLGKIKANGKDGSNKKNGEDCGDRRHTLALAAETPFAALFHDLKGQTKFEASSVILVSKKIEPICFFYLAHTKV